MFCHLEIDDSSGVGYWHPSHLGAVQAVLLPPVNFLSLGPSVCYCSWYGPSVHMRRKDLWLSFDINWEFSIYLLKIQTRST